MATSIMATSTTKLTLFHSILFDSLHSLAQVRPGLFQAVYLRQVSGSRNESRHVFEEVSERSVSERSVSERSGGGG